MTIANSLRQALATVRSADPKAIQQLDESDRAAADEAARAAKLTADKAAKVDKALPARTEALIADYLALQGEAIRLAATEHARTQLEAELGVTPVKALSFGGYPLPRLPEWLVERTRKALADRLPIPWDRAGRTAAIVQSSGQRAAHEAMKAAKPQTEVDDVDQRIAERRAMLEAKRKQEIAERKRAAGIGA